MSLPLSTTSSSEQSTLSVWKDKVANCCDTVAEKVEVFMQKHFALILFTISLVSLAVASPLALAVGTIGGAIIHWRYSPGLRLGDQDKVVTVTNTVFAIIGALAALIQFTPSGQAGGYLYHSIPWIMSLAVGSTGYRTISWLFHKD